MSISYQEAAASYEYGHSRGEARRKNTRPTNNVPPRNLNALWFEIGDMDGAMGRGLRSFRTDVAYYVGDVTEKRNYDLGFDGSSEPLDESARPWWEAGKQHKARGNVRLYYVADGAVAPVVTRPAPAYVPKPNPNAVPGLPPVVVNAPPSGGGNPSGYPSPVVVERRPTMPPWDWPPQVPSQGSGIILYGPGYYLDFSKLQPVTRR